MHLRIGFLLALVAGPAVAEPAGCPALLAAVEAVTAYQVTAPPAGLDGGWCVFDRAMLKAEGAPDLAADRLRLRGDLADGAVVTLALLAGGVRVAPGLGQRDMDPVLRETLRLQTAEMSFVALAGPDGLALQDGEVRLSGGTELKVEADLAGAGLTPGSLVLGRLVRLELDWRNDGKLFRPALQAVGERLGPGASGLKAVDAARTAMHDLVAALPSGLAGDKDRTALAQVIDALPQGRGRLVLAFRSDGGIGAAQLALAAFADDPTGPASLARVFAGASLDVDWKPGLAE